MDARRRLRAWYRRWFVAYPAWGYWAVMAACFYGLLGLAWANSEPLYAVTAMVVTTGLLLVDGIHAHK